MAQMLSSLSMRTVCANAQPYRSLPILADELALRRELEQLRRGGTVRRAGALLERVNTKMCPFEFTATPGTSPKFMPSGSLRKSGTDSNGISGAVLCFAWRADVVGAVANTSAATTAEMRAVVIEPPDERSLKVRQVARVRAAAAYLILGCAADGWRPIGSRLIHWDAAATKAIPCEASEHATDCPRSAPRERTGQPARLLRRGRIRSRTRRGSTDLAGEEDVDGEARALVAAKHERADQRRGPRSRPWLEVYCDSDVRLAPDRPDEAEGGAWRSKAKGRRLDAPSRSWIRCGRNRRDSRSSNSTRGGARMCRLSSMADSRPGQLASSAAES